MTHKFPENEHPCRIAVFPGSFDPFTIGHASIVERGLRLFDRIIIAIGYNEHKPSSNDIDMRINNIRRIYRGEERVDVAAYSGLTIDFAKHAGASFILRGIRGMADFEYERNLAEINRAIGNIETVLLYTLPEQAYISSSMVRELEHNGADVSAYLPKTDAD